jgi:hypothetical protein
MKTLTVAEIREWCEKHHVPMDEAGKPLRPRPDMVSFRYDLPISIPRLTWLSRMVEQSLHPREKCLFWITGWGVWPSSENWHLYYKLRQTYHDQRLIDEAPGHYFLEYESDDLVSFIQIGLISGWDIHIIPSAGYGQVFISHDEWIEFSMQELSELEVLKEKLGISGEKSA